VYKTAIYRFGVIGGRNLTGFARSVHYCPSTCQPPGPRGRGGSDPI